jgi:hypothetical protein
MCSPINLRLPNETGCFFGIEGKLSDLFDLMRFDVFLEM